MNRPKILVFAGSTRTGSFNRYLAREAAERLQQAGIDATLAELRDYPMPLYDGDTEASTGLPENTRAFKTLIREHDGILIASPEYNGSFPAIVKNLVDWVTRPEPGEKHSSVFRGKKVALLATSPGSGGGKRGLRHLRELLEMIGAVVIEQQVTVSNAFDAFTTDGRLVRPDDIERIDRVAAELAAI